MTASVILSEHYTLCIFNTKNGPFRKADIIFWFPVIGTRTSLSSPPQLLDENQKLKGATRRLTHKLAIPTVANDWHLKVFFQGIKR